MSIINSDADLEIFLQKKGEKESTKNVAYFCVKKICLHSILGLLYFLFVVFLFKLYVGFHAT